jgi:hypothetical protein
MKIMTNIHSIIGIFSSNAEAEIVVLELQKKGLDIKKLSLVKTILPPNMEGADIHPPHPAGIQLPHPEGMQPPYHPMGIQPPHPEGVQPPLSERVQPPHPEGVQPSCTHFLPGRLPSSAVGLALVGAEAAGILFIPGTGPVLIAGTIARTLVSYVEKMITDGLDPAAISATGGLTEGLGIPKDKALQYETEIRAGKYVLLISGSEEDVSQAKNSIRLSVSLG